MCLILSIERSIIGVSEREGGKVMEDRISKDGKRAKCATCGEWYGLDDYHGRTSPRHLGAELALKLEAIEDDEDRRNVADWFARQVSALTPAIAHTIR
jgi:hypothetical protein